MRDQGASLIELLLVLLVVTSVTAMSVPVAAGVVDASRARQAAAFVGSRFRLARQQAVGSGVNVAVVFDQVGGRWQFRACRDGNGNGLRRAEVGNGTDPCFDGPHEISQLFPGVSILVDPTLRGPAGEPPNPDPVRFGTANLASFSPSGSCTAGSVFLRSSGGAQYAVRIAGVTSRTRVLRYEPAAATWITP